MSAARWFRLATVAIGLWLMAAPSILGFDGPLRVAHLVAGPIAVTIGIVALSDATRGVRFAAVPVGLALAAVGLAFRELPQAALSAGAGGFALAGLALVGRPRGDRLAGGWRVLWHGTKGGLREPNASASRTSMSEPTTEPVRASGSSDISAGIQAADAPATAAPVLESGRGPVVVITGASAGVGRATARAFAERGARIGLLARGEDRLDAARREVEERGGRALAIPVDVADADAVERAAATVEDELGPIDIWVNNAMTSVFAPVREMTADEYRRVTEVTYLGVVHGTLAALRRMLPRDAGTIVQVGSALAYRSIPLQSAYCASKHAIVGFTDSLRSELLHDDSNVNLTIVHLPGVNTPQFRWVRTKLPRKSQPVGAIFQPELAAEAIVWAAEHHPRELKVGAPAALAILGQKVAPGLFDRYLARAAWEGQMTDEPTDPERDDNLLEPVPGDPGAHGVFDARARERSLQYAMATHQGVVRGIAVALGLGAGLVTLRLTRR